MIYFLPIILFIFYISIDIYNLFSKKKIYKISFFCIGIALIQLFLGCLTWSKINIDVYKIFAYIIVSIILFSGLSYIILNYFNLFYKKKLLPIIYMENRNLYISQRIIEWFFILSLMLTTFFVQKNIIIGDLTYYVSISKNFKNGIYSPTGNYNDVTSITYLIPQSYYTYAIFFKNIYVAYQVLNSIFYLIFIFSLISFISDNYLKSINRLFIKISYFIFLIFGALIFLYNLQYYIGGNLSIQVIGVSIFFLLTLLEKKSKSIYFIPFTFLFFSSTALIISIPLIISFFLYKIITYKNFNFLSISTFLFPFNLIISFVFYFFPYNNNEILIYYVSLLFIFIINLSLFLFFSYYKKIEFHYIKFDKEIRYIILSLISIVFLIIWICLWYIIPNTLGKVNITIEISKIDFLPIFVICLFLIYFLYLSWKKNNKNLEIVYCFIIFWLINILLTSFLYLPFSIFKKIQENGSYWRIVFSFIGMGSKFEVILLLIPILFETLKLININFKYSYKILSFLFISFYSIFSLTSIMHSQYFNKNISRNLKIFSNSEIEEIENINFNNYKKSYLTMLPLTCYINGGLNIDNWINFDDKSSWVSWWWAIQNSPNFDNFEKAISKENFLLEINRLSSYAKYIGFKNYNNEIVNKIDYIFLVNNQNRLFYINGLKGLYHNIYSNTDIIIMKLNDN